MQLKTLYKTLSLMLVMLFAASVLKAQQNQAAISHIAGTLSVTTEKAAQIQAALHYNTDKIVSAVGNRNLNQAQKQRLIEQLYAERTRKIDSLLTPQQKALLKAQANNADTTHKN